MVGGLLVDGGEGGLLVVVFEDRETLDTRLSRSSGPRVGGPRLRSS